MEKNIPEKKTKNKTKNELIYVVLSRSWQDATLCLKFLWDSTIPNRFLHCWATKQSCYATDL